MPRARKRPRTIKRAGLPTSSPSCPETHSEIPKVPAFDFVFLDAWKADYKKFFDLVFPRLTPRGLFLAHNVVNKQSEMKDFLTAIGDSDRVATSIVRPGSEGMSVTVKLK
jgi:predicted O-methyltransferase YrrM